MRAPMKSLTPRSAFGAGLVAALGLTATLGLAAPALASGGNLVNADLVGSLKADAPLFGVTPGGVDWTVSDSSVQVKKDGEFDAKVRNLLVTATQANPVATISASLVCNGMVVSTSDAVAFDAAGDARIKGMFTMPERCLAPAVLLNPLGRAGVFIAATGQG